MKNIDHFITDDWMALSALVDRAKRLRIFGDSYEKASAAVFDGVRQGRYEIKSERKGRRGPEKRFVRIKQ